MKITRAVAGKNKGKIYNAWVEGRKVYTQDVKTGYVSSMSRDTFRKRYRDVKNMKDARDYANGE